MQAQFRSNCVFAERLNLIKINEKKNFRFENKFNEKFQNGKI